MDTAKNKLQNIVGLYRKNHYNEWEAFIKSNKQKIKSNLSETGKFLGGDEFVERKILEIPETLFLMIKSSLNLNEFSWLFPQNNKNNSGVKWFAKNFPEFKAVEKI